MAAGLGFKTFATGEVLSAANVNGYLMQGILVFATEAARDAAITVPAEGQFAFTKDTNSTWFYDGAAWAASGGGISPSIVDAKGDLIAATAADAVSRLAVGANNTVLTADSAAATGMKWAASGGADYVQISRTTFSSVASQAFDSVFTSTYGSYQVVIENLFAVTSTNDLQFQFRYAGSTTQTTAYNVCSLYFASNTTNVVSNGGSGNNVSQITLSPNCGFSTTIPNTYTLEINKVSGVSSQPSVTFAGYDTNNEHFIFGGGSNTTERIYTGFLLKSSSSNISGTVAIYGRK